MKILFRKNAQVPGHGNAYDVSLLLERSVGWGSWNVVSTAVYFVLRESADSWCSYRAQGCVVGSVDVWCYWHCLFCYRARCAVLVVQSNSQASCWDCVLLLGIMTSCEYLCSISCYLPWVLQGTDTLWLVHVLLQWLGIVTQQFDWLWVFMSTVL